MQVYEIISNILKYLESLQKSEWEHLCESLINLQSLFDKQTYNLIAEFIKEKRKCKILFETDFT